MKIIHLGLFLLAAGMADAFADVPKLPQQVADFLVAQHYVAVPAESEIKGSSRLVVTGLINGEKVRLIVDSGATYTILNADCAERLKLEVKSTGSADYAFGGKMSGDTGLAKMQSFDVGGCELNKTNEIHVFPKGSKVARVDGLLGLDFLHLHSVVFPLTASAFFVRPSAVPVASIIDPMTKAGYTAVSMTFNDFTIIVNGRLNDQPMRGVVDTAATVSVFDVEFVRKAVGGDLASLHIDLRGADGSVPKEFRFEPKKLDLGGFNVPPSKLTASQSPIFSSRAFDVGLGADILYVHGAVVDLGDSTLWLK